MKTTTLKNERIHGYTKKQTHKRRELPLQKGPLTMRYNAYRVVTKGLRNRNPQGKMKVNEGPNLPMFFFHSPKHPYFSAHPIKPIRSHPPQ